jgi:hypothetical protein
MAIEMIDELTERVRTPPAVVADAGYCDMSSLSRALPAPIPETAAYIWWPD